MQQFLDSVELKGITTTGEGYLIADAFTVRTGIQRYLGSEVGKPELPFVDVYRDEKEVFSAKTLQSFSHVPVTDNHPAVAVTSQNWKDLAVGEASTDVLRDGHRMKIPLVLKDQGIINLVKGGKRELSAGYACDLHWEDGVTADGQKYQAKQVNIRANHIAVVSRGRAGPEFRIGDEAASWGVAPYVKDTETIPMQKILVDGITIETTDQGVQAIDKLKGLLGDSAAKITSLQADLVAKDKQIGELTGDLATAKAAIPSGATLDKLVADRVALLDTAKKVHKDGNFSGMTDAEVRKSVVAKVYGDEAVKDANDDVISGMFKAATRDAAAGKGVDPIRQGLMDRAPTPVQMQDNGLGGYMKNKSEAWQKAV